MYFEPYNASFNTNGNNANVVSHYPQGYPMVNSLQNGDRFGGFAVPFLLGGLTGGAAVAVSRPRPVVMNPYPPYPYYPGPYYGPRPY